MEVLEDPCQGAGRGVLRREQDSDHVVGDLAIGQRGLSLLVLGVQQAPEEVVLLQPPLLSLPDDLAQYLAQPLPCLHKQPICQES